MKSLAKLKDEARRHEQDEAWSKAIDVYLRVLQHGETAAAEIELPLYNRIGDLYVRLGEGETAVAYYEDAADRYAEAGLFNNAIALCNKALRYAPDRVELLRKLGQFSASQGFLTDARSWYLEYAERMFGSGDLDEAFSALEDFANLSDDPSVREILGRRLHSHGRKEQGVEELKRAYAMHTAAGNSEAAATLREEIYRIDPDAGELETVVEPRRRTTVQSFALPGLVELADEQAGDAADEAYGATPPSEPAPADRADVDIGPPGTVELGEDRESSTAGDVASGVAKAERDAGVEGFESTGSDDSVIVEDSAATADLPLLDVPRAADADGVFDLELPEIGTVDVADGNDVDEPLPLIAFDGEAGDDEAVVDGLGIIDTPLSEASTPEALARARAMVAEGRRDEAAEMLGALDARVEREGGVGERVMVLDARIELHPDDVRLHQSRIEALTRAAETTRLVEAFVALAQALQRTGARQQSQLVFQQVLELDPQNSVARQALGRPAAVRQGAGDYVDLGSLITEDEPAGESTRFYVAERPPTGDEDRDFAELLAQFKSKIAHNLPHEDAGSHYDLGLAYKEMGLVDEAISEFQIALRHGYQRLKVCEELGQCFFAKGEHNIAVKVLGRALEGRRDDELALIGVFYYLGRAHEELGQRDYARDAYERVLALDVQFRDVAARLRRL
jgi:tetratricopeptide (TPR) repeat protein